MSILADLSKYERFCGLDGDIVREFVLRWYGNLLDGTAPVPDVFIMVSDDDARMFLDEEDYAHWCDERERYLGKR